MSENKENIPAARDGNRWFCALRIGLFIAIALLSATVLPHRTAASEKGCRIANDMMRPHRIGDRVAGGWTLESTRCHQSGVYDFEFRESSGRKALVGVDLFAEKKDGERAPFLVYTKESGGRGAAATEPLLREMRGRIAAWDARRKRGDAVAFWLVAGTLVFAVAWLSSLPAQSKKGRREIFVSIQLSAAVLILLLSALELGFRVFHVEPRDEGLARFMSQVRETRILQGGYRREIQTEKSGMVDFKKEINPLGFRDKSHPLAPSPGTLRIACAGDSFMYGVGVGAGGAFPDRLQKILAARKGVGRVEVMNFAVPGASLRDAASLMLTEINSWRPDIVVYGYVLNDVESPRDKSTPAYYDAVGLKLDRLEDTLKRHDLGGLRRRLRLYNFLVGYYENRALTARVVEMYADGYDPGRNPEGLKSLRRDFELIGRYYNALRVPVVVAVYPLLVQSRGRYPFEAAHKTVIKIAGENGLETFDLLPVLRKTDLVRLRVSLTDHHPNRIAHRMAANAAADFLAKKGLLTKRADDGAKWRPRPMRNEDKKKALNKAKAELNKGLPDDAMMTLAPFLETNPGDCDAQFLAAQAMIERGACRAWLPKMRRLKAPRCRSVEREQAVLRLARKNSCSTSLF